MVSSAFHRARRARADSYRSWVRSRSGDLDEFLVVPGPIGSKWWNPLLVLLMSVTGHPSTEEVGGISLMSIAGRSRTRTRPSWWSKAWSPEFGSVEIGWKNGKEYRLVLGTSMPELANATGTFLEESLEPSTLALVQAVVWGTAAI